MMTLSQFECLLRSTAADIAKTISVEKDVIAGIKSRDMMESVIARYYIMRIERLSETKAFFDSMVSYLAENGLSKNTRRHILEQMQAFETAKKAEWPPYFNGHLNEEDGSHIYADLVQYTEGFRS